VCTVPALSPSENGKLCIGRESSCRYSLRTFDKLEIEEVKYHHQYSAVFASQGIGEQSGKGNDRSYLAKAHDRFLNSNTIDNVGLLL
jgi:hypothetical protein